MIERVFATWFKEKIIVHFVTVLPKCHGLEEAMFSLLRTTKDREIIVPFNDMDELEIPILATVLIK